MLDVAEQQGDMESANRLLDLVKKRMEEWFSGEGFAATSTTTRPLGTVVATRTSSSRRADERPPLLVRLLDPRRGRDRAARPGLGRSKDRWGGMIDLLIADIATAERGRADFPFLRNFDPYEGHSWASGIGWVEFGNNQESSSEAINAWAGLILWGELTGNRELRDLGVYMYTTEIEAIKHYWFDIHGLVLAPEYKNVEVSMLFGGKYAHNTWWTDDPRQIKGINLLPVTTASTYLRATPAYIKRNLAALKDETEIWATRAARRPSRRTSGRTSSPSTWRWPTRRRALANGTAGARSSWATRARTRCTGC
jgi:hypothetical protein